MHLAPVRERLADIIPLAEHFLRLAGRGDKRLSAEAGARLLAYVWPGNVREIKNAMERLAVLVRSDTIAASDLEFLSTSPTDACSHEDWLAGDLPTAVARLEVAMIERALQQSNGNRAEAARLLNIPRQQLYVLLKRHGLHVSESPTDDVGKADSPEASSK
jgi:DNA-binding NtrC family response regulator